MPPRTGAVAGQILTVTQIATNGAPIAQGTATGTSAEAANVVADTTTQGVTEALEVQTFDFTAWSVVDDGDTVSITVDGTTTTYTAAAGDGATSAAALAVFDAAAPAGYTYVVAGQVLTVSQTAGNGDAIAQGTIGGTGVGAELTGVSSNETPVDNVINVDTGDDVIALSTNALSKEVIVFDDYSNGNVDILNFSESGAGVDFIHLGDYLVDLESASDSVESQRSIALDVNIVTAAAGDALDDGNTVTVITDIDSLAVAGETWSGLTAALLLAAVKDSNTGTDDYAGIDEDTLDITYVGSGDLVGTAMNHIVMVENDLNEGEYKVFHLTSTTSGTDEFDSATLVGTVDFGTSVAFDTTNISIA